MHKTVIFGDIHGRSCWKEILKREDPDRVIFLGDYVTSREDISIEDQTKNLLDILDYKEENPDKVILLRGNHDLEACKYHWASCWPMFHSRAFTKDDYKLRSRFLKDTQWVYVDGEVIYSHAGISKEWFEKVQKHHPEVQTIEQINTLEPSKLFAFSPGPDNYRDTHGDSKYQPCVWIRPLALVESAVEGIHVVGHTRSYEDGLLYNIRDVWGKNVKGTELEDESFTCPSIWLCDSLPKSYLVKEDQEFKVRSFE